MFDREFYPTLSTKTSVLLYTLAKSQACEDGNKRIALILVETFLGVNDHELEATNDDLADQIFAAAESAAAERDHVLAELTAWLEDSIVPLNGES
jgi:prophage maintenance system killer protein